MEGETVRMESREEAHPHTIAITAEEIVEGGELRSSSSEESHLDDDRPS